MLAIKDMEMPKNCADCNMTTCKGEDEPWNYVCSINLKDIDFNETDKAEHCPLVEIVTCEDCIHREEYCCRHGHPNCKDNFWCAWDVVQNAPTIIKADKPKNGCSACPHSGSIIDGYKDCPDAYTKQSQYCGFNNKE